MKNASFKRLMQGICIVFLSFFPVNSMSQQLPYKNPNLSSQERAKDLISRLTLAEKAALMCDQSDAIPRLGIKKFNWWSEALYGYANNDSVTVFPEPIGMALLLTMRYSSKYTMRHPTKDVPNTTSGSNAETRTNVS